MADIILFTQMMTCKQRWKPYIITKKLVFAEDSNLVFLCIIQGFTSEMHILEGTAEMTEINETRIQAQEGRRLNRLTNVSKK